MSEITPEFLSQKVIELAVANGIHPWVVLMEAIRAVDLPDMRKNQLVEDTKAIIISKASELLFEFN